MIQYNIFTSVGEISIAFDDETEKPTLFIHGPKMIISKAVGGLGEEDEIMAWVTEKELKTIPVMMYTIIEVIKIASEYSAFTFLENSNTESVHSPKEVTMEKVDTSSAKSIAKALENELQDYGVESFDNFTEVSLEEKEDYKVLKFRITEDGTWYPESRIEIRKYEIQAYLSERYEGGDMWNYIENQSTTLKNLQKDLL